MAWITSKYKRAYASNGKKARGIAKYVPSAIQRKKRSTTIRQQTQSLRLTKPMKILVNRTLNKTRETKSVTEHFPLTRINSPIKGSVADPAAPSASSNIFNLMPNVSVGGSGLPTGSNQRDGNRINPVSLHVHGYIWFNPNENNGAAHSEAASGLTLRFYILSSKKLKNYTSFDALDPITNLSGYTRMANHLTTANGGTSPYTGVMDNALSYETNHDEVRVHTMRNYHCKRKFLLSDVAGYQDPVKIPFSFRVPCPKFLDYNNNTAVQANSFAPMLVCGWALDNGAVATSTFLHPQMTVSSTIKYKDS